MASSTSLMRLAFSMATPLATWIMSISSSRYSTSDTTTAAAPAAGLVLASSRVDRDRGRRERVLRLRRR